jgi:ketosteroid isomerase-like protein
MALAVTFTTNLTTAQYDEIWRQLRAQQAEHPAGRISHVGFEQDGVMRVVDVWNSMEEFEAFGATLMPIIANVGGEVTPDIVPARHQLVSSASDPKIAAVQRLYEAYGRGDVDAVLAEVSDDVEWAAEAASTSAPWYGIHKGKDDVARFFGEIGSNVDVTEFEPLSFTSNGTDVIVAVRWAYTVSATGKTAAMRMQHWWRFADGKIVSFLGSEDSEQSAAAFS